MGQNLLFEHPVKRLLYHHSEEGKNAFAFCEHFLARTLACFHGGRSVLCHVRGEHGKHGKWPAHDCRLGQEGALQLGHAQWAIDLFKVSKREGSTTPPPHIARIEASSLRQFYRSGLTCVRQYHTERIGQADKGGIQR